MKNWFFIGLLAWAGTLSLEAQTIKLPTKKNKATVTTKEQSTTKSVQDVSKPAVSPISKPHKTQGGTLALPTVRKNAGNVEAMPQNDNSGSAAASNRPNTTGQFPLAPLPVITKKADAPAPETAAVQRVAVRRKVAPRAKTIVSRPKIDDNEVYESADHMPTYPGGVAELMKFISENLQYPEEALANGTEDLVQVSFIVEKDGTPTEFEVIDEHDELLEAEAVRVLQQMPKWNPATQDGIKVRVEYIVPVRFKIPNK